MPTRTIDQVNVTSKRVLMRVDFNVPFAAPGVIADDRRIRMALPSIRSVLERGGRLILMSHCGRPKGTGYEADLSLAPAAERLAELLDQPVGFPSQNCVDAAAGRGVASLTDSGVLLLENLRFDPGEKKGDAVFAGALAELGEIYCNDAFGTAHRNDASMVAVPQAMGDRPKVAGFLLQRELKYLRETLDDPRHPFVAVLGGAKVSDKLGAIHNLIGRVDTVLVGGAMAYTFLEVQGTSVGDSRVEPEMREQAAAILERARQSTTQLCLPTDHVCGREFAETTPVQIQTDCIESGWMGLDIGPRTAAQYAEHLEAARTIVFNGPMGVFEMTPFSEGTRAVTIAIAEATDAGAVSIVGGGDSAAAVEAFGLADRISHVSTGGGASLKMLEGETFRSVELLDVEGVAAPKRQGTSIPG